jgi:protein-disulfide isomerase
MTPPGRRPAPPALALALATLAAWLAPVSGAAAPPATSPCSALAGEKRALADKLTRSARPYDCCDEPLDRCLAAKSVCRLAVRLRDEICRRVARGEGEKLIQAALEKRARSMGPVPVRATFDLASSQAAGDPKAKVKAVVYACARCPFCRRVVPILHDLATSGALKGRFALYFRPYPITRHKGSTEGGLGFVAAQKLARFWPFALKLFSEYDRFAVDQIPAWAASVGIDRPAFEVELAAPATRRALVDSKKEGLRNGVEATPTLFIDGRMYHGDLDREMLADVLEEEVERMGASTRAGGR